MIIIIFDRNSILLFSMTKKYMNVSNVNFPVEEVGCVILSAGLSSRMKKPKAFLPYNKQENFLQHIINVYLDSGIKKIRLVIHPSLESLLTADIVSKTEISVNSSPEKDRLYSLQLGLQCFSEDAPVFIQNVDNPFVNSTVLKEMLIYRIDEGYVVPSYLGHPGHPVLIGKPIIQAILECKNYTRSIKDLLHTFTRKMVTVFDPKILVNINTPEEYEKYFGSPATSENNFR